MHAERVAIVSQATLMDVTVGISWLIEDAVTAFVALERKNRVNGMSSVIPALLQSLVSKTLNKTLISVKLEDRHLREIEEASLLRRTVKKLTAAILKEQDYIASLATIVRKETKKAPDADLDWENRRQNLSRSPTVQGHGTRHQASDLRRTSFMNRKRRKRTLRCQKNKHGFTAME